MAEQINPENNAAAVETATPAIADPKKRGPRARKLATDSPAATAEPMVPAAKEGRARKKTPGEPKTAVQSTSVAKPKAKPGAKATGKGFARKSSPEATESFHDEIADLRQLEEENARLRRALGEKLRSENGVLRKRLGLN